MKTSFFRYGITALMMAFAMTMCYSCSSDDDEEATAEEKYPPSNRQDNINGHAYVELEGIKWATENVCEAEHVFDFQQPENDVYGYRYKQMYGNLLASKWGSEYGYSWAVPTKEQWNQLIKGCYWEWADNYHDSRQAGYIVYKTKNDKDRGTKDKTDSGYSPNTDVHIFLPAAGYFRIALDDEIGQGSEGAYWASADDTFLYFCKKITVYVFNDYEAVSMSLRLVAVPKEKQ